MPTNGLPADKALALAQFIRFAVGGTGQADITSLGAAPATPAMAAPTSPWRSSSTPKQRRPRPGVDDHHHDHCGHDHLPPRRSATGSGASSTGATAGATGNSGSTSGGLAVTGGDPVPLLGLGFAFVVCGEAGAATPATTEGQGMSAPGSASGRRFFGDLTAPGRSSFDWAVLFAAVALVLPVSGFIGLFFADRSRRKGYGRWKSAMAHIPLVRVRRDHAPGAVACWGCCYDHPRSAAHTHPHKSPTGQAAPAVGPASLQATNVSAWFGSNKVLERVSLEMEPRKVTALIGPSGCGKSTFLRILNRMHELVPSAALVGIGRSTARTSTRPRCR